jgi:hypothetical protein
MTNFHPALCLTQTRAHLSPMGLLPTRQTLCQTQSRMKKPHSPQENAMDINNVPRKSQMG